MGGGQRFTEVELDLTGPSLEQARRVLRPDHGRHARRSRASSTSTRRCRCASPSCACRSTARRRPTSASTCRTSPRRCAPSSAASRSRSSRRSRSSTTSGCAPSSPNRNDPQALGDLTVATPSGELVRLANLATLSEERGPAQIDRYNRQRKVTIVANLDHLPLSAAVAQIDRRARRARPAAALPRRVHRPRQGARRDRHELRHRLRPQLPLHVHDPRRAVRELPPPDHDPAGAAADDPVRAALAGRCSARRSTSTACSASSCSSASSRRTASCRSTTPTRCAPQGMARDAAILEANHVRLRPILMTTVMLVAGMIPIALGRGPGAGVARLDGQGDHRRPDALAAAHPADDAGGLLAVRRPGRSARMARAARWMRGLVVAGSRC